MIHEIKILKKHYEDYDKGKNFEIRKNDRNYQAGDSVFMTCVEEPDLPKIVGKIRFVSDFNQQEGFVVFSLDYVSFLRKEIEA